MGTIIITDRTSASITLTMVTREQYDKIRQAVIDGDVDLSFENPDTGRAITFAPGAAIKVEWDPQDPQPEEPTPPPVPARTITDNPQA
jgi:hypothetical protein